MSSVKRIEVKKNGTGDDAVVDVRLFGERHLVAAAPAAGVANLTPSNAGLGRLSRAIGAGIVANLHRCTTFHLLGVTRITQCQRNTTKMNSKVE